MHSTGTSEAAFMMLNEIEKIRVIKERFRKRPKWYAESYLAGIGLPSPKRNDILHGFKVRSASVYVVDAGENIVKIGISDDPGQRVRSMQTSQDRIIRIFWAIRLNIYEARNLERIAHKKLVKHRTQGEWFSVSPSVAVALIQSVIEEELFTAKPDISYGMFRGDNAANG